MIVLDGSTNEEEKICNEALCFGASVSYHHFSTPEFSVYSRIAAGLGFVETPYTFIVGDDDFLLPASLLELVQFLEANRDYSSCCGETIVLSDPKEIGTLRIRAMTPRIFDQEDPIERMYGAFTGQSVSTIFYALHRTYQIADTFERCGRATKESPIAVDFSIADPLLICLILASGKQGKMNVPLLVRDLSISAPRERGIHFGDELLMSGRRIEERYQRAKAEIVDAVKGACRPSLAAYMVDAIWGLFAAHKLGPNHAVYKFEKYIRSVRRDTSIQLVERPAPRTENVPYPLGGDHDADALSWVVRYDDVFIFLTKFWNFSSIQIHRYA